MRLVCSTMKLSLIGALLWLSGCAQTPYAGAGATGANGTAAMTPQQQSQIAQQNKQLEDRARLLDMDNNELNKKLALSIQQEALARDQLAAVKDQLGSVNTQLAQLRDERRDLEQKLAALSRGGNPPANAAPNDIEVAKRPNGVFSNSSMSRKLPEFRMQGIESRVDGDTIRIEIPADRVFDVGQARIRSDATGLLDNILIEVERLYGQQYIGIEGNTDNEPLSNQLFSNAHQLTTARATALFDYVQARTRFKPQQLSVVGHGANHPIVSNGTVAGRAAIAVWN